MKRPQKKTVADNSRRIFIGYGAAALILTPLALTGCGDNQGDNREPPKGGGTKKPRTPKKTDGGGDGKKTQPGKYTTVEPSEIASKQTVTVDVFYKGKHVEWTDPSLKMKGLPPTDGQFAMGELEAEKHYPKANPLGTKYVVNERVLTLKEADKVKLCNVVVVLVPKGPEKVAVNKNTTPPPVDNAFFRFDPRVASVGKGAQMAWKNGDQVKHEVNGSTLYSPMGSPPNPQPNPNTMGPGGDLKVTINVPGWYGIACGLHTWELGRIMVSDHAYNVTANAANKCKATIADVADGDYELQFWHETKDNEPISKQNITVNKDKTSFSVEIEEII